MNNAYGCRCPECWSAWDIFLGRSIPGDRCRFLPALSGEHPTPRGSFEPDNEPEEREYSMDAHLKRFNTFFTWFQFSVNGESSSTFTSGKSDRLVPCECTATTADSSSKTIVNLIIPMVKSMLFLSFSPII
mgnify:CR=1 FL=1